MHAELALKLVPILEAYFDVGEILELQVLFEVDLSATRDHPVRWLSVARELTTTLAHGNTRRFVDNLLDLAESRNRDGLAHASFERLDFQHTMVPVLAEARVLLESAGSPSDIIVAASSAFAAKSHVRELLETTTTEVLVVDPYVGVGTLDCLRNVYQPIRILTGSHSNSVEPGFDRVIRDFQSEGHQLQVRRANQLHDRHLVFNGRCWLVGGSLKDAGRKAFNCIEITDKTGIVADLEARWLAGLPFP